MNKSLLFFIASITSGTIHSQVGINTTNPQGVFNIDGKKDNPLTGAPSVLQQANDVVVMPTTGYLGVGTTIPSNQVHIKSTINPVKIEGLKTGNVTDNILTIGADNVVNSVPTSVIKGTLYNAYQAVGTTSLTIAQGTTADIPGATVTFTVVQNTNALITSSAIPLPALANAPIQGTINLLQNGVKIDSQFYSGSDAPGGLLVKLGNYTTLSSFISLTPGTYTFKMTGSSWYNGTVFNLNPVSVGYAGAAGIDSESMKGYITVLLFNK
jgi:hypothetical protein